MSGARQVLDRVQSLGSAEALAADPGQFAASLACELPAIATFPQLDARDAALISALGAIDDLAARVMRLRLDVELHDDTTLGPPTRRVFASTIVSYAGDLSLLARRVGDIAGRGGSGRAERVAEIVVEAARATLALRDAVRAPVLDLIRELATATRPEADRRARDRTLDDAERKRWSAARRDLETLAADPARIQVGALSTRLAAWPEQLDEPAAEPEVTFADMIELD